MKHRSPIVFEGTMFPEICVLANPDYVQGGHPSVIEEGVKSDISVECINREERRFVGELRVQSEAEHNKTLPYKIDILCVTSLQIDPDVPDEYLDALAMQAAHAMAFPAVRELILTLTARQPWGQFSIGMAKLMSANKAPARDDPKKPAKKRPRTKKPVADK